MPKVNATDAILEMLNARAERAAEVAHWARGAEQVTARAVAQAAQDAFLEALALHGLDTKSA